MSSSCSGTDKLRRQAFSDGNPAFEVIKLTFVFFMASLLAREVTLRKLCWLLLWQVSYGNPGAFKRSWKRCNLFAAYLVLIYVSTRKPAYLALELQAVQQAL
ncbi:MAG: hypothetical protein ACLTZM_17120 [Ruminococcus sp.]